MYHTTLSPLLYTVNIHVRKINKNTQDFLGPSKQLNRGEVIEREGTREARDSLSRILYLCTLPPNENNTCQVSPHFVIDNNVGEIGGQTAA